MKLKKILIPSLLFVVAFPLSANAEHKHSDKYQYIFGHYGHVDEGGDYRHIYRKKDKYRRNYVPLVTRINSPRINGYRYSNGNHYGYYDSAKYPWGYKKNYKKKINRKFSKRFRDYYRHRNHRAGYRNYSCDY